MKSTVFVVAILLSSLTLAQTPEPTPPAPVPQPQQPQPTPPPPPPPPPPAPAPPAPSKWFYGGGLGLSFGTVDYVSISPMIGYHVVPRFDVALQPFYSYTSYDSPDFTANNYGADLIARFNVFRRLFLEGRYEWISYQYLNFAGNEDRKSDSYPFAGVGYYLGRGHVGVAFSALYNFSYDDNDPFRPYDSPWIFQATVGVGF